MHAAAPKTPLGSQAGAGMMPNRTHRLPGVSWGRNVQARLPLRSHIQGRRFHCMAALSGIP